MREMRSSLSGAAELLLTTISELVTDGPTGDSRPQPSRPLGSRLRSL